MCLWFGSLVRLILPRRGLHAIALLFLMLVLPIAAQAAGYTYTAGSFNQGFDVNDPRRNLNWHNEFNWEPQGIPGAGDSATISSNASLVF